MTDKPRSPLDTAAMRICNLTNSQNRAARANLERYWDLALTPMGRSLYRAVALEVFRDLAPEGVAPREDGADTP